MPNVQWAAVVLLLLPNMGGAQRSTRQNGTITDVLARTKSRDWIERYKGFEEATALLESGQEDTHGEDELRRGLILLLVTETAAKDTNTIVNDVDREGYSNYCGDLLVP
jgi:hypothetical protein